MEKKIEKKENKRSMSYSDNTKYWSCNDMMIILLQYDDHHLQFANCFFQSFFDKTCRFFNENICLEFLQIIKNNFFVRFATFLLDHFVPDFQIVVLDHFLDFLNFHFTSFLLSFLQKLQIVVPNQFLCQICNPGQAIPKLL